MSDLAGPEIELQTSRTDDGVFSVIVRAARHLLKCRVPVSAYTAFIFLTSLSLRLSVVYIKVNY